jgi:hypothetical protein
MKNFTAAIKLAVLGCVLALSACNLPSSLPTGAGPYAWIDAPLNGFRLPLSPYDVVYHGSDSISVSKVELKINDVLVSSSENPAPGEHLATLHYTWIPAAPGTYTLRARTQNSAGKWSDEAVVTVTVGTPTLTPNESPSATFTATATTTVTTTATATVTASPIALPASFAEPTITPQVFSFMSDCPDHKVTATIGASDPDGIKVVVLFYRLRDKSSGAASSWQSVAMKPQGSDQFTKTLEPAASGELHSWAQSRFDTNGLGWEAWLDIQFVIQDNHGDMTRSKVYSVVTLKACNH